MLWRMTEFMRANPRLDLLMARVSPSDQISDCVTHPFKYSNRASDSRQTASCNWANQPNSN